MIGGRPLVAVVAALMVAGTLAGLPGATSTTSMAGHEEARVLGPSTPAGPLTTYALAQPTAYPLGVTTDARGDVWFAEDNVDQLVELFPANSTYRYFPIPTERHLSWIWFLVFDQAGNLWFSDESQPLLWRFSTGSGDFANFSAGTAQPYALALDSVRSRIWFTSIRTNQVGYFQVEGGAATLGNVSTLGGRPPGPDPSGIAVGADGNVYVAETLNSRILELSGSDMSVMETWALPPGSEPVGLALDSGHGRIWFTNHATSFFGYVGLGTAGYVEFPTSLSYLGGRPIVTLPYWITVAGDGMVWFDEHFANRIARFDPITEQLTEFPIPQNESSPLRIWLDQARGELWFTEFSGNAVGMVRANSSTSQSVQVAPQVLKLSPSGVLTVSADPQPSGAPTASSTSLPTGAPDLNFSVSSAGNGGSLSVSTKVVAPGNYTLGVCYSYPGTTQCGYATLEVEGGHGPDTLAYLLYGGVAAVAAALLILTYREAARRPSSRSVAGKKNGTPSRL